MGVSDCRSRKILVVGDPADPEIATLATKDGFGLMQMPPAAMSQTDVLPTLMLIADQLEDYIAHGYSVGLPGVPVPWSDDLIAMLRERDLEFLRLA